MLYLSNCSFQIIPDVGLIGPETTTNTKEAKILSKNSMPNFTSYSLGVKVCVRFVGGVCVISFDSFGEDKIMF